MAIDTKLLEKAILITLNPKWHILDIMKEGNRGLVKWKLVQTD